MTSSQDLITQIVAHRAARDAATSKVLVNYATGVVFTSESNKDDMKAIRDADRELAQLMTEFLAKL
jgi:DNA-binding FrmR family transcriptional regulator